MVSRSFSLSTAFLFGLILHDTKHYLNQFLFISDAMESFSTPNPRGEDSAVLTDDQESPETTPAPSPGSFNATPASCGSSFASRRGRSSFAPSSPSVNNGMGGRVTGRGAPETSFSKLPASNARSSTAQPNTSGGLEPQSCAEDPAHGLQSGDEHDGGRRDGGGSGKPSPPRSHTSTPAPKIDTGGLRSPANISRSPVDFARY